jgi:hypothetical protein
MRVLGIDFTSSPNRRKPITCLSCALSGGVLSASANDLHELHCWDAFESALSAPGPWIAGIDFPFGQSRTFIKNIGWPLTWAGYVEHVGGLERAAFREALNAYRVSRRDGDKEHRRKTDFAAGSISPQKLYGVPVGLMFFAGAPRLLKLGVTIPGLAMGDPTRVVVEAYPKLVAIRFVGRRIYKNDSRRKQSAEHRRTRHDLIGHITNSHLAEYGLSVTIDALLAERLLDDATGDRLDALLCAVQAAWACTQRETGYGAPYDLDALEGWIADPNCSSVHQRGATDF